MVFAINFGIVAGGIISLHGNPMPPILSRLCSNDEPTRTTDASYFGPAKTFTVVVIVCVSEPLVPVIVTV